MSRERAFCFTSARPPLFFGHARMERDDTRDRPSERNPVDGTPRKRAVRNKPGRGLAGRHGPWTAGAAEINGTFGSRGNFGNSCMQRFLMIDTPSLVTFTVYLVLLMAIGVYFYRTTVNLEDYLLGGRGLGRWVTAFSAQASDMSGWLMMGLPGAVYLGGVPAASIAIGLFVGTALNWRLVAARLRVYTQKTNSLTLASFFEERFEAPSGLLRRSPRSSRLSSLRFTRLPALSPPASFSSRCSISITRPRSSSAGRSSSPIPSSEDSSPSAIPTFCRGR